MHRSTVRGTNYQQSHLQRQLKRSSSRSSATSAGTPSRRSFNSSFDDGDYDSESAPSRGSNFKVVIRVRPPLPRELEGSKVFQNVVKIDSGGHTLIISENLRGAMGNADDISAQMAHSGHVYTFDHVYGPECTQSEVYNNTAKGVVESALAGYNATIFAYGQTGTGKTYTMEGFNSAGSLEARGIIPRSIEQIFQHIDANISARMRFLVRASYLQIYNESISDLLKPERNNLVIREDKKRGVFVEGLSEWVVRTPAEIYGLMERGGAIRATGSTKMNEMSSRSHAVFIIIAEQSHTTYVDTEGNEISVEEFTNFVARHQSRDRSMTKFDSFVRQSFKVGKLNLVDLAGSERVRLSGATGQRLQESRNINQSLSALGNVISALTDAKGRQHIPYRDSKLTRILQDSLGGNCKTTMMAMISPALEAMLESVSTLKFANRAKNIKNEAHVNEDYDQKSLLRKYERELKKLRSELEKRSKNVVDKRRLLELDEQRRRAEQDKMAAIRALEERSMEFMREKEEKRRLEQRISMLTSQMLMGHAVNREAHSSAENGTDEQGNDLQLRVALKEHQEKIKQEYEGRLADLEKERETIEEEKAQVDRYKQLLLKQRDIMIALTQRLNERDEQIMALQDELDAYDRHQKELEEKLDEKTAQLIHLQRVTIEHNANSPTKNADLMQALGEWGQGKSGRLDSSNVPPTLLITHPQFAPHGNGSIIQADTDDSGNLLSAKDKIKELEEMVARQEDRLSAANRDLDQTLSEKVDLEKEKAPSIEHDAMIGSLRLQLKDKEAENASLRKKLTESVAPIMPLEPNTELVKRCETLAKERRAIQTIMEQKIKALVTAVSQASTATIDRAGGIESVGDSGKWLQREIAALNRLVSASITALRNAEDGGKKSKTQERQAQKTNTKPESTSGISVERLIQQRRLQMQQRRS